MTREPGDPDENARELPDDPHELLELLRRTRDELAYTRQENVLLHEKIDLLLRRLYGAKSERIDSGQLRLLFAALGEEAGEKDTQTEAALEGDPETGDASVGSPSPDAPAKKEGSRRRRRAKLSLENLPVGQTILIDPEAVKACPEAWEYVGEERSEKLDYQAERYQKLVIIRRRFRRLDPAIKEELIAPMPPALIEGGMVTERMLAHIIVEKFVDHLPLHRQEARAQRWNALIPRQTTCRWLGLGAFFLEGIIRCLLEEMRARVYLQIDETMMRYLIPGTGRSFQGYMWVLHAPGEAVYFHWEASRAASVVVDLLQGAQVQVLQCDGYSAYDCAGRQLPGVVLAGCWAHVRRKFFEICRHSPLAAWVVDRYGVLSELEARLRETGASPEQRREVRDRQSRPILAAIREKLEVEQPKILPGSALGKAVNYALNQWESLELFLGDGRIEISNNFVENQIRPTAVGKKNYLFFGSEAGGKTAAAYYTLAGNCRILGINPEEYFCDVLTRLPTMTNQNQHLLTPRNWLAERTRGESRDSAA